MFEPEDYSVLDYNSINHIFAYLDIADPIELFSYYKSSSQAKVYFTYLITQTGEAFIYNWLKGIDKPLTSSQNQFLKELSAGLNGDLISSPFIQSFVAAIKFNQNLARNHKLYHYFRKFDNQLIGINYADAKTYLAKIYPENLDELDKVNRLKLSLEFEIIRFRHIELELESCKLPMILTAADFTNKSFVNFVDFHRAQLSATKLPYKPAELTKLCQTSDTVSTKVLGFIAEHGIDYLYSLLSNPFKQDYEFLYRLSAGMAGQTVDSPIVSILLAQIAQPLPLSSYSQLTTRQKNIYALQHYFRPFNNTLDINEYTDLEDYLNQIYPTSSTEIDCTNRLKLKLEWQAKEKRLELSAENERNLSALPLLLRNANFSRTVFAVRINFSHADLSHADFSFTLLKRQNFASSLMAKVNLAGSTIKDSILTACQLKQANLYQVIIGDETLLNNANLDHANLREAIIRGKTRLTSARLEYADLSRAKLIDSTVDYANLRGACLDGTQFENIELKTCGFIEKDILAAKLVGKTTKLVDILSLKLNRLQNSFSGMFRQDRFIENRKSDLIQLKREALELCRQFIPKLENQQLNSLKQRLPYWTFLLKETGVMASFRDYGSPELSQSRYRLLSSHLHYPQTTKTYQAIATLIQEHEALLNKDSGLKGFRLQP